MIKTKTVKFDKDQGCQRCNKVMVPSIICFDAYDDSVKPYYICGECAYRE